MNTRDLYFGVLAISALFALILVVYVAIRYRDDMAWLVIPFFISIGILVWASIAFFHIVKSP